MSLGRTKEKRQAAYRELSRYESDPGVIDAIRHATNDNYALGNERFKENRAQVLGRRVTPGKSGRPRKNTNSA